MLLSASILHRLLIGLLVSSLHSIVHSAENVFVSISGSEISFSCSSSDPPVWNRIQSLHDVRNLAYGDKKMTRFQDER